MDTRNTLSIRLTEPFVFLRSNDPSGRHAADTGGPPALVRGLLTLNLTKPTKISTIDVELRAVVTSTWPEDMGVRRIDMTDDQTIYSARTTYFRADEHSSIPTRRTASVGPGLSLIAANDLEHDHKDVLRPPTYSRGQSPNPQGEAYRQLDNAAPVRHASCDLPRLRLPVTSSDGNNNAHDRGLIPPDIPSQHSSAVASLASTSAHLPHSVSSSLYHVIPLSRHSSSEDVHSGLRISPSHSHISHSPDPHIVDTLASERVSNSRDTSVTRSGRTRSRFSLATMLHVVKEVTGTDIHSGLWGARKDATGEVERGRAKSRADLALQHGDVSTNITSLPHPDPHASQPSSNTQKEHSHHFLGLGYVFGLDRDGDSGDLGRGRGHKEQGDGWKEFKKVVLPLPTNLPPTYKLPWASLSYTLYGVAHRPGPFSPKLTCLTPIVVVSAPAVSGSEGGGGIGGGPPGDPGPVSVERLWDRRLGYAIDLSGRLLVAGAGKGKGNNLKEREPRETVMGGVRDRTGNDVASVRSINFGGSSQTRSTEEGTITLGISLAPLEKVKVWRMAAGIEERITYLSTGGVGRRDDTVRRTPLWNVYDPDAQDAAESKDKVPSKKKDKTKEEAIPLLPTPLSPHRSPLLPFLRPGADPSELAGPGPYTLSTNLAIPGCHNGTGDTPLNFTIRHRNAGVHIDHTLRVVIRVERLDNSEDGAEEDLKKRQFDIVIQVPVIVLSCRCTSEWQTLPRYCEVLEADTTWAHASCPCDLRTGVPGALERVTSMDSGTSSFESGSGVGNESGAGNITSPSSYPRLLSSSSRSGLSLGPSALPMQETQAQAQNVSLDVDSHTGSSNSIRTGSEAHTHAHTHAHANTHSHTHSNTHSHSHSHSHSHAHTRENGAYAMMAGYPHLETRSPTHSPHRASRSRSPLPRCEWLAPGQQSEVGEAPPSYESIAGRGVV